jgi:hypothetical protein
MTFDDKPVINYPDFVPNQDKKRSGKNKDEKCFQVLKNLSKKSTNFSQDMFLKTWNLEQVLFVLIIRDPDTILYQHKNIGKNTDIQHYFQVFRKLSKKSKKFQNLKI